MEEQHIRAEIGAPNYSTAVKVREFSLQLDEPLSLKGGNTGPSPFELLGASLAGCMAVTLKMYVNLKGWSIEGIKVDVVHKSIASTKSNLFEVHIEISGALDEKKKARLKYIAVSCPVHKALSGPMNEIRTKMSYVDGDKEKI